MATFKSWLNSRKYFFKEKGLQWVANELDQILNSKSGLTAGEVLGTIIIDAATDASGVAGTGTIQGNGAGTFSGQFNGGNSATTTAGGVGFLRADPRGGLNNASAGGFGPGPARQSPGQVTPTEGFRTP